MRVLGLLGAASIGVLASFACGDSATNGNGGGDDGGAPREGGTVLDDGSVAPTAACKSENGTAAVAMPTFVRNLAAGETGWYSSPAVVDLDGDGKKEIVAPLYSTFVFDAQGKQVGKGTATQGRVYAPAVVADLDGDGAKEIVVGGNK